MYNIKTSTSVNGDLAVSGSISGSIELSPDSGNSLVNKANGLFAQAATVSLNNAAYNSIRNENGLISALGYEAFPSTPTDHGNITKSAMLTLMLTLEKTIVTDKIQYHTWYWTDDDYNSIGPATATIIAAPNGNYVYYTKVIDRNNPNGILESEFSFCTPSGSRKVILSSVQPNNQIKVLQSKTDYNTIVESGIYLMPAVSFGEQATYHAPFSSDKPVTMIVNISDSSYVNMYCVNQIVFGTYQISGGTRNFINMRTGLMSLRDGSDFSGMAVSWEKIVTLEYIQNKFINIMGRIGNDISSSSLFLSNASSVYQYSATGTPEYLASLPSSDEGVVLSLKSSYQRYTQGIFNGCLFVVDAKGRAFVTPDTKTDIAKWNELLSWNTPNLISTDAGNGLEKKVNGLFVQSSSYTAGNGLSLTAQELSVKIDPASGNIIKSTSTGLYASNLPSTFSVVYPGNITGQELTAKYVEIKNDKTNKENTLYSGNVVQTSGGSDIIGAYQIIYQPYSDGSVLMTQFESYYSGRQRFEQRLYYADRNQYSPYGFISSNNTMASENAGNAITYDNNGNFYVPNIVRRKSEIVYSNLSIPVTTSAVNLIEILKSKTPQSGTLSGFFNTTSNKLNVYNENSSVHFKVNLIGSWSSGSSTYSFALEFPNTIGNTMYHDRTPSVTNDVMSFHTFFSVDKGGQLATQGTPILCHANAGTFTITQVLLIAEQEVPETATITAV